MPDGCRLSARIWLPEDAEERPVPAILEYIPYRKDDATAARDAAMHPYFAGHGYAAVRVDIRGSGDSDGILSDEYLPLEQQDGLEVLRWLAAQSWCSGKVGMIGKPWGGFNALQIAAHGPPELGAVISVASTDDRYADDVHYMGGCLPAWDMLGWASTMLAYNGRPPDPDVVGERWRSMWLDRLEKPLRSWSPGSPISAATSTGVRVRSARTTRRSSARCTWSAAGRTPIATRSCAFWRGLPANTGD
jgi:uncharacterized protein